MRLTPEAYLQSLAKVNRYQNLLSAADADTPEIRRALRIAALLNRARDAAQKTPSAEPRQRALARALTSILSNRNICQPLARLVGLVPPDYVEQLGQDDATARQIKRALSIRKTQEDNRRRDRLGACHNAQMTLAHTRGGQSIIIPYTCTYRYCGPCARERSLDYYFRAMDSVHRTLQTDPSAKMRWITLTVKNMPRKHLKEGLSALLEAWRLLRDPKRLSRTRSQTAFTQAAKGYLFNVEITYNRKAQSWHPHVHVLYLGSYCHHESLQRDWEACCRRHGLKGRAVVGACYTKGPQGEKRPLGSDLAEINAALREVTKYMLKPLKADEKPEVILELIDAINRRRLIGSGGTLRVPPKKGSGDYLFIGGLASLIADRDSALWTDAKFQRDILAGASADPVHWARIVRTYGLMADIHRADIESDQDD